MTDSTQKTASYTVPGMSTEDGARVAEILQDRLNALNDLHLTLKHVHWNVVGPNFISVHEMLDPQVEAVRGFADDVAERIATLGGSPKGTPGTIVAQRSWGNLTDELIGHSERAARIRRSRSLVTPGVGVRHPAA